MLGHSHKHGLTALHSILNAQVKIRQGETQSALINHRFQSKTANNFRSVMNYICPGQHSSWLWVNSHY